MAHGHGLFSTPENVRSFEAEKRTEGMDPVRAALFNAGFAGGGAIRRGISGIGGGTRVDTRSRPEQTAENIQQMIQGMDLTDRDSVLRIANRLQQSGHMAEANQLLQMAPDAIDNFTDEEITMGGQKFLIKMNTLTKEKTLVAGSSRPASAGSPSKNTDAKLRNIEIKKTQLGRISQQLLNQPTLTGPLGGAGKADEEDVVAAQGAIEELANRLLTENKLRKKHAVDTGAATQDETNAMIPLTDVEWQAIALDLMLGGGNDLLFKNNLLLNGQTLKPSATLTQDIGVMRANFAETRRRNQVRAEMADEFDPPFGTKGSEVFQGGDGFNMYNINENQARGLFAGNRTKPEEIFEDLTNNGFTFTPEAREWHMKHWAIINENKTFMNKYFNILRTPEDRVREFKLQIPKLTNRGMIEKALELVYIRKYFELLNVGNTEFDPNQPDSTRFGLTTEDAGINQ